MDEINDFMDFSKPFERVTLQGPRSQVAPDPNMDDVDIKPTSFRRPTQGDSETDYAREYQNQEMKRIIHKIANIRTPSSVGSHISSSTTTFTTDTESLVGFDTETETIYGDEAVAAVAPKRTDDDVHQRYLFNYVPPNLPIVYSRTDILQTIQQNPAVVLQGATGCGKSTQVPQMILANAYARKEYCNIIVTQPRKIAAYSLAQRVCSERKLELGRLVGYQVGLNVKVDDDTRITFCTTGVLLEKLIRQKTLRNYTHIILDEVHERDKDMDFLFIIVRRLLTKELSNCKIILMSATIETPIFAKYFEIPWPGRPLMPAPVIKIERKSTYSVREFYLDDLTKLKLSELAQPIWEEPNIHPDLYIAAVKLLIIFDRLDEQYNLASGEPSDKKSTVLIFLPGIYQIDSMFDNLKRWQNHISAEQKLTLIPLHSTIPHEEQQRAFKLSALGYRKIILTTNIAESSITVPEVKYVIDFCLEKQLVTDSATNISSLQLVWTARNNLRQRSGRAGRVMNGRVYRLIPKVFFNHYMQESGTPEMLRSPMATIVLKSKILDEGSPQSILALAMDPPDLSDINNTVLELKEVGALLRESNGEYTDYDGDLTFIGRVMASLPLDVRSARMVIMGHCFNVLDDMIIMAAGLSVQGIFATPFKNQLKAYSNKLAWADGSGSDLIAVHKAYTCWLTKTRQGHFEGENTDKIWARRYFLQLKCLREMNQMVEEITDRLKHFGIREYVGANRPLWTASEKSVVWKIVIAGAFYPNYFIRSNSCDDTGDREAFHRLNGRDPCNTVYFSGFDQKYIGPLYQKRIKDILKDCTPDPRNMLVSFDSTSEKIFVTFRKRPDEQYQLTGDSGVEVIPGQVATEVFKAIKYQKLNNTTDIFVMQPADAVSLAEEKGLGMWEMGHWTSKEVFVKNPEMVCIPRLNVKNIRGKITHIQNLDKFWFQSLDEQSMIQNIFDELNQPNTDLEPFESPSEIKLGQVLAALGDSGHSNYYYRARVERIAQSQSEQWIFDVVYLDIGSNGSLEFSQLRCFHGVSIQFVDVPPRVFECRLAEIAPSSLSSTNSQWTEDAKQFFIQETSKRLVTAEVYSVVNGVAIVYIHNEKGNINEALENLKLAQYVEESYMSKANHEIRFRRQKQGGNDNAEHHDEDALKTFGIDYYLDVEPPDTKNCPVRVTLRGPNSPLEITLRMANDNGSTQQISVDQNSVNSVLLETNNDAFEKLLVAATISESPNSGKIVTRNTTLMPNIPGFLALTSLIFCPYMEPMRDKLNSRYISLLCGLGQNPITKEPVYPEHDMLINLDIALEKADLTMINKLRYIMSSMLLTQPGQEFPNVTEPHMKNYSSQLKRLVIELFGKNRSLQPVQYRRHTWGKMDEKDVEPITKVYGPYELFAGHSGLKLIEKTSPDLIKHYQKLNENAKELHDLAACDVVLVRPSRCKLCDVELSTNSMVRIHLHSRLHKDRVKEIHMPESYN